MTLQHWYDLLQKMVRSTDPWHCLLGLFVSQILDESIKLHISGSISLQTHNSDIIRPLTRYCLVIPSFAVVLTLGIHLSLEIKIIIAIWKIDFPSLPGIFYICNDIQLQPYFSLANFSLMFTIWLQMVWLKHCAHSFDSSVFKYSFVKTHLKLTCPD